MSRWTISSTIRCSLWSLRNLTAPRTRAEAAALDALRTISLLILLYLLCVLGVGALLFGFIMRPLRRLMTGTRAIGEGDLGYRIAAPGSDEFSDLAHEFDRMVGQLQETTVSKDALQASEKGCPRRSSICGMR